MSDLESDDDIPELAMSPSGNFLNGQMVAGLAVDDDRRAHHNALERKRRDHIKDSFSMLREVVPTLKGEKASRALILKKAADYIHLLKNNIASHQKDILELKRQNSVLEAQVNAIESGSDFVNSLPCTEQVEIDAQASAGSVVPMRPMRYDREIVKVEDQVVSSLAQAGHDYGTGLTSFAPMPIMNFSPAYTMPANQHDNEPANQQR